MRRIGETIYFGRRGGTIVGHTTFARHGHAEEVNTFYVVDLHPESRAYLEPVGFDGVNDVPGHDCFISIILVNVDSFDDAVDEEVERDILPADFYA